MTSQKTTDLIPEIELNDGASICNNFVTLGSMPTADDAERLEKVIDDAIATAHEEGRQEGFAEAVKVIQIHKETYIEARGGVFGTRHKSDFTQKVIALSDVKEAIQQMQPETQIK